MTEDMKTFINTHLPPTHNHIETALISELLTCPLTSVYGLYNTNITSHTTIHIIGASSLETVDTQFWELILHMTDVKLLNISFIGPDLSDLDSEELNLCVSCKTQGKRLHISYHEMLYHEFCRENTFVTPDLILMFNCGLHEFEGSESDTWKDSLSVISKLKCNILLTSFTKDEADKDVRRLVEFGRLCQDVKWTGVTNMFASLRPFRDLESLGVYFNNAYISLVSYTL